MHFLKQKQATTYFYGYKSKIRKQLTQKYRPHFTRFEIDNCVLISGFDLKSYRQSLTKWNSAISAMNDQCEELGPNYCLKVYYEQLILHPRTWLTKILKFLELDWTEDVMHHEKQINKPHGISLSKVERSSDQVKLIEFQLFTKNSIASYL